MIDLAQYVDRCSTGYVHHRYAESLAQVGTPRFLPQSRGWILQRSIPASEYQDAMGCYPLFACEDWSQLRLDLDDIGDGLICLSLVTDPFGECDEHSLRRCFKDVVFPFKEHFVVDLSEAGPYGTHPHHRRNVRRALRDVRVERCQAPDQYLDEFSSLYDNLIRRHNIKGIPAFSRTAFAGQLQVPGLVMFRAVHQDATVGITLWYTQRDVGYYHLGAYSDEGYRLRASFPIFATAIEHFAASGHRWLDLGAGAGIGGPASDGLARFKQGWSTGTRTVFFCGRIFDSAKYREIVEARRVPETSYFPAYRRGEFGA